ncbi:MAG: hypothetical protein ACRD1S_10220 [Vicinamibacterales bacterium]
MSEDECAAIEREYFDSTDALDAVRAAEDDLVDDYVLNQLSPDERERFERHYLSTPCHRRRVAVARALRTAASAASGDRRARVVRWWPAAGLAAATAILVVGGFWMLRAGSQPETAAVQNPPPAAAPPPPRPVEAPTPPRAAAAVAALSISPILVRGADQAAVLAIASGTDVVRLQLEGGTLDRPLRRGRAIIRTVGGQEIWRGPATVGSQPQELARVEIPAARLRPEDYMVELLEVHPDGREVELYRYFFRVRAP